MVLREMALYSCLTGDSSKAKKLITKSQKAMSNGNSEISSFLHAANIKNIIADITIIFFIALFIIGSTLLLLLHKVK
jgi:hypothetical protein